MRIFVMVLLLIIPLPPVHLSEVHFLDFELHEVFKVSYVRTWKSCARFRNAMVLWQLLSNNLEIGKSIH